LEAFEENCFEDFDDFFVYLHSVKKYKVATIIGYRSAISSKHKGWGGRSVSTNGDLSKLIKGYLKFPSFTDNACNSLTLDAVANAIKNTVFHVKNFTSQDKRGSKGCLFTFS
jgi:hypothetical protein